MISLIKVYLNTKIMMNIDMLYLIFIVKHDLSYKYKYIIIISNLVVGFNYSTSIAKCHTLHYMANPLSLH